MITRVLDKRLKQIEGRHSGSPILVLLVEKGESSEECRARWERQNGPMGDRHVLCVNSVKAELYQRGTSVPASAPSGCD